METQNETPSLPKTMKIHPFARTFETLSGPEMEDLRADIKANGIVVPIVVTKKRDTIIDGRNRWMIATELGITDVTPYEVFAGKDEEIEAEILRLNVFRRHLTDDQRVAAIVKVRGPQLEAEGKARQAAGGKGVKSGSFNGKGAGTTTVAQLASEAKTTPYKAQQAEDVRKAGMIDDVIQKKTTLKQAAKKVAGSKKKRPIVERTFEDEVWLKWSRFLKSWPQTQHREVIKHVTAFIEDRRPADAKTPSAEKAAAKAEAEKAAAAKAKKTAPAKKAPVKKAVKRAVAGVAK